MRRPPDESLEPRPPSRRHQALHELHQSDQPGKDIHNLSTEVFNLVRLIDLPYCILENQPAGQVIIMKCFCR